MNDRVCPVPDKVRDWLSHAVRTGASDLHLIAGYPPVLRLHGDLIELSEPPLEGETLQALLSALCPAEAFTRLQAQKNVDFSLHMEINGQSNRFRANLFHTGGQM